MTIICLLPILITAIHGIGCFDFNPPTILLPLSWSLIFVDWLLKDSSLHLSSLIDVHRLWSLGPVLSFAPYIPQSEGQLNESPKQKCKNAQSNIKNNFDNDIFIQDLDIADSYKTKNTFLTFDIAALNNICSQHRIIMLQFINVLINILYLTDIPNMIWMVPSTI